MADRAAAGRTRRGAPLDPAKEHDPHESARHRIDDEHPSFTAIETYLVQLDQACVPQPLAMVELTYPGEDTATYLLTLGQADGLERALTRLRMTAAATP